MKKTLFVVLLLLISYQISQAQFVSRFALFGGLSTGWHIPNLDELNLELNKAGIPNLSTSGAHTLGGGGYIDVPKVNWLRLGYMATGFTMNTDEVVSGDLKKNASLVYRMGGLSAEYINVFSEDFDFTIGTNIGLGSYTVNLYQVDPTYGNWGGIFGEIGSNGSSQTLSRNLKQTFYTVQPKVGIGFLPKPYLYFKLNAGYSLTMDNGWKDDNGVKLTNVPGNIKSDGFFADLSLNLGLFFR